MNQLAKEIGERVRYYRLLKGWTQEQLAEALDSQGTYVGRVERGEQNLQLQTLEKIADALQVNIYAFFDRKEPLDSYQQDEWIWKIILMLKERDTLDQERAFRVLCEMFK